MAIFCQEGGQINYELKITNYELTIVKCVRTQFACPDFIGVIRNS